MKLRPPSDSPPPAAETSLFDLTPDMASLPTYLRQTDPMELEDLPLQVALLTMELASLRLLLGSVAGLLLIPRMGEADGLQ